MQIYPAKALEAWDGEAEGYTAVDMATARAEGFRDGQAVLSPGTGDSESRLQKAGQAQDKREAEIAHIELCITNLKAEHQSSQRVIAEVLHNIGYSRAAHPTQTALSTVTAERDRLREEMAELWKRIDKFQSQSHGITALAEIERIRAEVDKWKKTAEYWYGQWRFVKHGESVADHPADGMLDDWHNSYHKDK